MNDKLHELTLEIMCIEKTLASLSAPMLELVLEKRKALQYELDTLQLCPHKKSFTYNSIEGAKEVAQLVELM